VDVTTPLPTAISGRQVEGDGEFEGDAAPQIDVDLGGDEFGEPSAVVVRRPPAAPTQEEIRAHEVAHEPYRSWCPACVAGRGRAEYHWRKDRSQDSIPSFGVDYGYLLGAEDQEGMSEEERRRATPLLCGRFTQDRWIVCIPMPCKGVGDPYCARTLGEVLVLSGHRKIIFVSDGEPSIVALKRAAAAYAGARTGVEIIPEVSAEGDSQANGLAEGGVKECKAKIRTIKYDTERMHNIQIPPTHSTLTWMGLYAAALINRARRGPDGKTAWELRKGRPCRRALAPFGEKCLFLPKETRHSDADSGYTVGFFMGCRRALARSSWRRRRAM